MVRFLEEDLIEDAQERRADEAFLSLGSIDPHSRRKLGPMARVTSVCGMTARINNQQFNIHSSTRYQICLHDDEACPEKVTGHEDIATQ
jgi:hypothetical protein